MRHPDHVLQVQPAREATTAGRQACLFRHAEFSEQGLQQVNQILVTLTLTQTLTTPRCPRLPLHRRHTDVTQTS